MTHPVAEMDRRSFRTSCRAREAAEVWLVRSCRVSVLAAFCRPRSLVEQCLGELPRRSVNEICAGHGQ